jgi:hypothetical protein
MHDIPRKDREDADDVDEDEVSEVSGGVSILDGDGCIPSWPIKDFPDYPGGQPDPVEPIFPRDPRIE